MSFLARFRQTKVDPETARRAHLLRTGRLGEATVSALDPDEQGNLMLAYSYSIGGTDYEAFQSLDAAQLKRKDDYLPGSRVQLRFDPHRPANSLVV